jgi:3-dehydroquinate synthase
MSDHRLRHGEAVAIGTAIDVHQSVSAGLAAPVLLSRVVGVLERLDLPIWDSVLHDRASVATLATGLEEFRQHLGGALCVTLLADVGRGVDVGYLRPAWLEAAIDWLASRARPKQRALC